MQLTGTGFFLIRLLRNKEQTPSLGFTASVPMPLKSIHHTVVSLKLSNMPQHRNFLR
jgi:hypothetical protein